MMKLKLILLLAGTILLAHGQMDDEFDPDMMDEDDMMDDDVGLETMDDGDDMEMDDEEYTEPETVSIPREERPVYQTPKLSGSYHFLETFEYADTLGKKWIRSKAKKDGADDTIAKYDGLWEVTEANDPPIQNDLGLILKSRARHHAVAAKLDKPFKFDGSPFIVQYEVNFQNGQECGGAYIKLLSDESKLDLSKFFDKTGYTIMFGPDKCGNDDKLHFIFRHKNPKTKEFEEKHAKKPSGSLSSYFTDKKTHLYTLVVKPDNNYEVYVDQTLVNSGNLLQDMDPPVNPPKEIVDPKDKKPEDWDERERIEDPDAVKPADWDEDEPEEIEDETAEKPEGWLDDEPELVPNPEVEKPSDWDDDMDGEFEAPLIDNPKCKDAPGCGEWKRPVIKNPKYKGKWSAPMIDNPNYKGIWEPRKIPNPDYFEDNEPYKMTPIGALGLELWSMSDDIIFDNFIITDDKSVADDLAAQTWRIKRTQELSTSSGKSVVDAVMDMTNERPWLWVLIGLVVLLPIVLIFNYCCSSSSSQSSDADAQRKKTDAPSPDDVPDAKKSESRTSVVESSADEGEEAEEKEAEEKEEKAAGDQSPSRRVSPRKAAAGKKPSKSDLEAEEEEKKSKVTGSGDKRETDSVRYGDMNSHGMDFTDDSDLDPSVADGEDDYEPEFSPYPSSRDVTKGLKNGN